MLAGVKSERYTLGRAVGHERILFSGSWFFETCGLLFMLIYFFLCYTVLLELYFFLVPFEVRGSMKGIVERGERLK